MMNVLIRDRKGDTGTQGTEGHVEVEATGRGLEGSPPERAQLPSVW